MVSLITLTVWQKPRQKLLKRENSHLLTTALHQRKKFSSEKKSGRNLVENDEGVVLAHVCEPSHQHQREKENVKMIFLLCTRKICHFFLHASVRENLAGDSLEQKLFFRQMLQLTSRWIEWQKWSLSPWRKRKIVAETWCNRRWSQLKFSENDCRIVLGWLFFNVASHKKAPRMQQSFIRNPVVFFLLSPPILINSKHWSFSRRDYMLMDLWLIRFRGFLVAVEENLFQRLLNFMIRNLFANLCWKRNIRWSTKHRNFIKSSSALAIAFFRVCFFCCCVEMKISFACLISLETCIARSHTEWDANRRESNKVGSLHNQNNQVKTLIVRDSEAQTLPE